MRARALITLIAIGMAVSACNERAATAYDCDMTVMIDQTDAMTLYPTAEALLGPLGLRDSPYRGIRVRVVAINAEDITQTQTLSIGRESPYTSNKVIREARVRRFEARLQACLDSFRLTRSAPRSVIFRAVAREAGQLQRCRTGQKCLLVFSDLMEFSDVSFYDPETFALVRHDPGLIGRRLGAGDLLPDLTGLQVWLLYAPQSYGQNSRYMTAARLYEHVYAARHAVVRVGNQFALP